MNIDELSQAAYYGWYVADVTDNKITLRSDYTDDPIAEVYISIENGVIIVEYFCQRSEGEFETGINISREIELSTQEIADMVMIAVDNYFN